MTEKRILEDTMVAAFVAAPEDESAAAVGGRWQDGSRVMEERRELRCKMCGWIWHPYFARDPIRCPNCTSYRWKLGPRVPKVKRRPHMEDK